MFLSGAKKTLQELSIYNHNYCIIALAYFKGKYTFTPRMGKIIKPFLFKKKIKPFFISEQQKITIAQIKMDQENAKLITRIKESKFTTYVDKSGLNN